MPVPVLGRNCRNRRQDSAKTRMQSQAPSTDGAPLKYRSTVQTLSYVVKAEGISSLWKGFTPYFARSGTHTVGGAMRAQRWLMCHVSRRPRLIPLLFFGCGVVDGNRSVVQSATTDVRRVDSDVRSRNTHRIPAVTESSTVFSLCRLDGRRRVGTPRDRSGSTYTV